MVYEAYERKMMRIAVVLRAIRKYRVLILSVIAAALVATGAYLATRGMITTDVTPPAEPYTYGQEMSFEAKALFSEVSFEFRENSTGEWSEEAPLLPGT